MPPAIAACVSASPPSDTASRIASSTFEESRKATIASGADRWQDTSHVATVRTVSSVNRQRGSNSGKSVDFVNACSCTEPMTSPAITPIIASSAYRCRREHVKPMAGQSLREAHEQDERRHREDDSG